MQKRSLAWRTSQGWTNRQPLRLVDAATTSRENDPGVDADSRGAFHGSLASVQSNEAVEKVVQDSVSLPR